MKKMSRLFPIIVILSFSLSLLATGTDRHHILLANDKNLSIDERLEIIDSLLKKQPDNRDMLVNKWDLALRHMKFKKANEAISVLYNCHFDSLDIQCKCYLLRSYSDVLMVAGRYDKAISVSLELLQLEKPDSLKRFDFDAYMSLADIDIVLSKHKRLDQNLQRMESCYLYLTKQGLLTPEHDKTYRIMLLKGRINQSLFRKNWDSLAIQADSLLEIGEQSNDTMIALASKANVYKGIGRFDLAEKLYISMLKVPGISYGKTTAVENYMAMMFDQKRFADVVAVADRYIPELDGNAYLPVLESINFLKAMSLAELGHYADADSLYRQIINSQCERNVLIDGFISEDIANYNIGEKMSHNMENETIIRRQRRWLTVNSLLFVLSVGACVFLWVSLNRVKSTGKARMAHMETESRMIENTKRELTSKSLQLLNQNEMMNRLDEILRDKKTSSDEKINSIKSILINLEVTKTTWETFRSYFDACHKGFFDRLYRLHPNLTENDSKVCAYMMLNITTKEMAAMTHRSVRSIDTIKYRLHKKLNLPEGVSTLQYIREVAGRKD